MLTKDDLKKIDELVKRLIIAGIWHLPTKDDIKQLATSDQVSHLPTKNEFFTRMDKLSGQLLKVEQSLTLHDGQHAEIHDHEEQADERLKTIEKRLGIKSPATL